MALSNKGISDHTPLEALTERRCMTFPGERPIARQVARDRGFAPLLQRTLQLWANSPVLPWNTDACEMSLASREALGLP